MSSDDVFHIIYLSTLILVLGGSFFLTTKIKLTKTLQTASIWVFIFFGAIAVIGLWGTIKETLSPKQIHFNNTDQIVVSRQMDGHYYITLYLNDTPIDFIIDTGASDMVLTRDDAVAAGLKLDTLNFLGRAITANGEVRTASIKLKTVAIGNFKDVNVPAVVNNGQMRKSLLGMDYLQRWGKIEIYKGELILSR